MQTPQRAIGVYCRISQDKGGAESAVKRQRGDCERHVRKLVSDGLIPEDLPILLYVDNDISATQTRKKRKHFEQMLIDAEAGRLEAIVGLHVDRLYRSTGDMYRVAQVVASTPHLTVHTVNSGKLDFGTPAGRLAAIILAAVGEYEVEQKKVRQQDESNERARSGLPRLGGRRPFGYDADAVTIRESEAEYVRDATRRLLAGESVSSLIREWNRTGVRTVRGGEWNHSAFMALMTRSRNAGIRQHRKKDFGQASWPALVDPDDFHALRKMLLDPSRLTSPDKTRKHLLSFLLKCERCGGPMTAATARSRGREYPTYRCAGRADYADAKGLPATCRAAINYDVAESVVRRYIADRLATPDAELLAVHESERKQLRGLRSRRAELDNDERVIESSRISAGSRIRQLEQINDERHRLDSELSLIARRVALASLLAHAAPARPAGRSVRTDLAVAAEAKAEAMQHFESLDLDQRREIVRALCEISVSPAQPGVSYKFGRSFSRVSIWPRNPMTGEIAAEPLVGEPPSQLAGQSVG